MTVRKIEESERKLGFLDSVVLTLSISEYKESRFLGLISRKLRVLKSFGDWFSNVLCTETFLNPSLNVEKSKFESFVFVDINLIEAVLAW